jgi:serine protease inhibitor
MTYAGARGETERQMADTLHFTLPQERLHRAFNALDAALVGLDQGEDFQLRGATPCGGRRGILSCRRFWTCWP